MAKPHNFRVIHRFGVSTTPRVIQCLNTGRLSAPLQPGKSHIVQAHGHTFHIMKRHHSPRSFSIITPYEGNWPRLSFWTKRVLEVFA